jgi:hypothetical protein
VYILYAHYNEENVQCDVLQLLCGYETYTLGDENSSYRDFKMWRVAFPLMIGD